MYNIKNSNQIQIIDTIFGINTPEQFRDAALAIFNYQVAENEVYRDFVSGMKIKPSGIAELEDIPFLPIEFFKTHKVITNAVDKKRKVQFFTSSGVIQSRHYVKHLAIYERSYKQGFEYFYGNIKDYCILALLPSYMERGGSSLVYMVNDLIRYTEHPSSGFYLHNYDELIFKLKELEQQKQKTILLGVTYALLNLIEEKKIQLNHTIIMETGGMKGKRKEMVREELHSVLCKGFGVNVIHSEYGMTELLSQAYSKGNGMFYCPPWMKLLIRDTNDPLSILKENKTGGINIIDLANINSCSFIATQDLGKTYSDTSFEILGRFDNSDLRGCNLLLE